MILFEANWFHFNNQLLEEDRSHAVGSTNDSSSQLCKQVPHRIFYSSFAIMFLYLQKRCIDYVFSWSLTHFDILLNLSESKSESWENRVKNNFKNNRVPKTF